MRSIEPRGFLVSSSSAHPSQPYPSHQPPPVPRSTHPHFSAPPPASAPARAAPIREPTYTYEHASYQPAPPPLSRSVSNHPPFHEPVIPARRPSSGQLPHMMQRSTAFPIPGHPNAATSVPHHDSSPPSNVYRPPHAGMPGGPHPNAQNRSYRACTTLVYPQRPCK